MVKQCEICGKTDGYICTSKKFNKVLCSKHYMQMKTFGKILERTIFDLNKITINGDILEISLYNRANIEICKAYVDAKHYDIVKEHKWCLNGSGYVQCKVAGKVVQLHKLITGTPSNLIVDHIDHNKLNCCDSNLRICTQSENMCNQRVGSTNTSGYKGVSWNKAAGKWIAKITVKGDVINLGCFDDKEDAIAARKTAEIKHHGEFRLKEAQ